MKKERQGERLKKVNRQTLKTDRQTHKQVNTHVRKKKE